MTLTAADILAASDIKRETVDVPEWGGPVIVQGLTGVGRDAWLASMREQRVGKTVQNSGNSTAKLLVRSIVDDEGNLVFKEADAPALGKKSSAVLERLAAAVLKLSGLADEASSDAEGNSEGGDQEAEPETASDGSTSA